VDLELAGLDAGRIGGTWMLEQGIERISHMLDVEELNGFLNHGSPTSTQGGTGIASSDHRQRTDDFCNFRHFRFEFILPCACAYLPWGTIVHYRKRQNDASAVAFLASAVAKVTKKL